MLSSTLLRRSAVAVTAKKAASPGMSVVALDGIARRFKSDDVGDVIGIDLGTTNSCVSIMVRNLQVMPRNNSAGFTYWIRNVGKGRKRKRTTKNAMQCIIKRGEDWDRNQQVQRHIS